MTGTADLTVSAASPPTGGIDEGDRSTLVVVAVAAAATFLAGLFPPPDGLAVGDSGPGEVRTWLESNAGSIHLAVLAVVVAAVGLVVVAAAMSSLVRRHRAGSILPELMLGGAVATSVVLVIDVAAQSAGLLLPGLVGTPLGEVPDQIVVGWVAVAGVTHLLSDLQVAFLSVVLVSGSLAALRVQVVNRWLCYAGLVVGAAAVLGTISIAFGVAALYPFWFVALFGFYASMLVLAVSALLARRRAGRVAADRA